MTTTLQTSNILATLSQKTQNLEAQDMDSSIPIYLTNTDKAELKDSIVVTQKPKGVMFVFDVSTCNAGDTVM